VGGGKDHAEEDDWPDEQRMEQTPPSDDDKSPSGYAHCPEDSEGDSPDEQRMELPPPL